MNKKLRFVILFILVLITDQSTKRWAMSHEIGQINFGFVSGFYLPYTNWIHLFGLVVAVVLALGLSMPVWARTLMIAGGTSNLLDRLLHGGVYDWLSMPIIGGYNNLADWAITIGVGWWLITLALRLNLKKSA